MQPALLELPRVLVGRSPKVQAVLQQIEKVSSSRWPVLILGETGTGKELIAKNLHSRGMPGPFVVVDCSSLVGPVDGERAVRTHEGRIHRSRGDQARSDRDGERRHSLL